MCDVSGKVSIFVAFPSVLCVNVPLSWTGEFIQLFLGKSSCIWFDSVQCALNTLHDVDMHSMVMHMGQANGHSSGLFNG